MTVLRTTQQIASRTNHSGFRGWRWAVLSLGLFGCGTPSLPPIDPATVPIATTPGVNDPAWLTSRERLPAPSLDRLDYDPPTRTLAFFNLPGRDVWMIQLPGEEQGRLAGPSYQLPAGVDTSRTLVFYSRPGMKVSAPVTVAAIEAGRRPHTSTVAFGH